MLLSKQYCLIEFNETSAFHPKSKMIQTDTGPIIIVRCIFFLHLHKCKISIFAIAERETFFPISSQLVSEFA